jgi:hypothetical protein
MLLCSRSTCTSKHDSVRALPISQRDLFRNIAYIWNLSLVLARAEDFIVNVDIDPGEPTVVLITLGRIGQLHMLLNKRLDVALVIPVFIVDKFGSDPTKHLWRLSRTNLPRLVHSERHRLDCLGNNINRLLVITTSGSRHTFENSILAIFAASRHGTRDSTMTCRRLGGRR